MDEIKFDGNKLFKVRKEKGLSQEKLALAIGVSRQTIYLWESNQSLPDVEKVSKICKVLEVELSDLVDGVTPKDFSENSNNTVVPNKRNTIFKRIVISIIIIIMLIYISSSLFKCVCLSTIFRKWKKLSQVNQYYVKISEYVTNKKDDNNNMLENKFCEIYCKNQILKMIFKDAKDENISYIIMKNYKLRNKYIIDVNDKVYRTEKMDDNGGIPKIIDNYQTIFSFENNVANYAYAFNPKLHISNRKSNEYILTYNKLLVENINKETGIITYEENIDSSLRQTKRYYEVELNTDRDFEINLDEYTEVE